MIGALGPVLSLMGPTAAGKTDLAVWLADRLPLDIVSVDSAMVYRGMNIGTGKPDQQMLARAPHRLIDIRDPHQRYSAAEFRTDAMEAIAQIHRAGRVPLLVGGTGLYFKALESGLTDLPGADPDVRRQLDAQAARYGWAKMHERLARCDPVSAARIHPNDPQRIQRALEVFELAGRPLGELQAVGEKPAFPYRVYRVQLTPTDRSWLHLAIADRFRRMLAAGLVDEVLGLRRGGGLSPALPAMRAVGYRQVCDYLDGRLDYNEMVDKTIIATRQLARRQLTWLRAVDDAYRVRCDAGDVRDHVGHHFEGSIAGGTGGA